MSKSTQPARESASNRSTKRRRCYSFDCIICSENIYNQGSVDINDYQACFACFNRAGGYRDQFQAHLLNEMHQPKFGGAIIRWPALRHVFPWEFVDAYDDKLREYAVPAAQRLYCAKESCSEYLGDKQRAGRIAVCLSRHRTCRSCSGSIVGLFADHNCEKAGKEEADAFVGLVKGIHYQKCPKCPAKLELAEACNHMKCPCGAQFCFICGQSAEENDNHWMQSTGCPRWGAKGSPDAIFDDDDDDDYDAVLDAGHNPYLESYLSSMNFDINDAMQRRDAAGLGSENMYNDLYGPLTRPERNDFAGARRTYRRRLYELLLDVGYDHAWNVHLGMDPYASQEDLYPIYIVAMVALISLDYFTAHLEFDRRDVTHDRYTRHHRYDREEFNRAMRQVSDPSLSAPLSDYDGLAKIVTAYQLAQDNRIDELRDYLYTQRRMRRL